MVHGGNFPVSRTQIYLFAAGENGYEKNATSLITLRASGVSCSNAAVSGACYVLTDANGSLASAVPYMTLNEVTTIAFAYAMSGFATTPYSVSSDVGGENALANAGNIVGVGNGVARAVAVVNSNSVLPYAKINTLANILATCVNTQPNAWTGAPSTSCPSLLGYATSWTGTTVTPATDEGSAIFNIAHNQARAGVLALRDPVVYDRGGRTGEHGLDCELRVQHCERPEVWVT